MLTESQQQKFRKVLDLNWECKELEESRKWNELMAKGKELREAKEDLRQDMGEEAYNHFIDTGRKMFAPKED